MSALVRWTRFPGHRAAWVLFAGSVVGILIGACGTDPSGVESCRSIEEARCRRAPSCNINLDHPVASGGSTDDKVEACVLWYRDACLHGLEVADPGSSTVQSCIAAINTGDCNVVEHPESSPACAWLVPEDQRPDAGPDAR